MSCSCPICFETIQDALVLDGCKHVYCRGCISEWLCINKSCPYCRRPVGNTLIKKGAGTWMTIGNDMTQCVLVMRIWGTHGFISAEAYARRFMENRRGYVKITIESDDITDHEEGAEKIYYAFN